jgi:large subunit ribosomal protein L3
MAPTLLGTKIGMTRIFTDANHSMPVTAIAVGPCVVTQVKTEETDGYSAVQIGFQDIKPRNATIPMIGHDGKAGTDPKRVHREFTVSADEIGEYEVGQVLTADALAKVAFVDVIGTSKGKGFQGGMKRHNFKGQLASHGVERKHRSPGSIGGHGSEAGASGRLKKGKRMSGHMGHERVTMRSLDVVRIDADKGIVLVKGPVPGPNKGVVMLRPSVRLYKTKSAKAAELAAG